MSATTAARARRPKQTTKATEPPPAPQAEVKTDRDETPAQAVGETLVRGVATFAGESKGGNDRFELKAGTTKVFVYLEDAGPQPVNVLVYR